MSNAIKLSAMALVCCLATLAGCRTDNAVASDVAGQWSGTPERMNKKVVSDGTFTPVFTLNRVEGQPGGNVEFRADLSVTMPVNAPIDSTGTSAVSATAAGVATVRGNWRVDDGDEIKFQFDLSTLAVDMDPEVQFELANIWTSTDAPTAREVPAAVKKAFLDEMKAGIQASLQRLDELDDVRVDGNLMHCKYFGGKRTLNRVLE